MSKYTGVNRDWLWTGKDAAGAGWVAVCYGGN